jgi:hypothetical protein
MFHPRDLLLSTDVILAVDTNSNHEALVYGRDFLEQSARTGGARDGNTLRVEIDMDTDEVEQLTALVTVVKVRHDYRSSTERNL